MTAPKRLFQVGSVIFDLDAVIHCTHSPSYKTKHGIQTANETILYFSGTFETDNSLVFIDEDAVTVWELFKSCCMTLKPAPWEAKKESTNAA